MQTGASSQEGWREGWRFVFRLIKAMLFPPSRRRLWVFLRINQLLFKVLLDLVRDPDKVFWNMMEEAAGLQVGPEDEAKMSSLGDIADLGRTVLEAFQATEPSLKEKLIPLSYVLETERLIQATLEQDPALVYTSIYKRIQRVLEGRNKPLFVPFTIPSPDAELVEHLKSGDAVHAVERIEAISFERVLLLIPDGNALVHLVAADDGTFGIITPKDTPPEIVLCKSFTRQKVENLLRGWMWLYYWHREDIYAQAAERVVQRGKMSQEEAEGFREAYQRIPYGLLFYNQSLFDHLRPTEIPASDGIPVIPFPSWLVMEAILRELGKGDLVSGEGLWQRLDENLYPRRIRRVILCPDKAFALFPHHGAILNVDRDGHKECVLDRYEIVYLPQGTLVGVAPTKAQPPRLLVFGTDGEALSSIGVANLRALAPEYVSEWHAPEGHAKLTKKASKINALAFLGHGEYDWEDPSLSFLGLLKDHSGTAYNDVITLENLVEQIPPQLDLITLAGCETGLPKITARVSDYKGFAEDLLSRCGVSAVVSALWPVQQVSTVLLICQFHKCWLLGDAPATALRKAQLWLRALTREQVIVELEALASIQPSGEIAKEIQALRGSIVERPYAHPYFWSTFYVMGGVSWIH
jgi:hypothetical protein